MKDFLQKWEKNHSTLSISVQSHHMISIRKDWVSGHSGVQLWLITKNDIQCQLIMQCVKRCLSICPVKPVTITWSSFAFLKRNTCCRYFWLMVFMLNMMIHDPRFHKRDHNRWWGLNLMSQCFFRNWSCNLPYNLSIEFSNRKWRNFSWITLALHSSQSMSPKLEAS